MTACGDGKYVVFVVSGLSVLKGVINVLQSVLS